MKKLTLSIKSLLLFVLLVSLVGSTGLGQPVQAPNTETFWTVNGCWISIDAHASLDMGSASNFSPGDTLEGSGNNVEVKSNCLGYSVDVEATQFSLASGHPLTGNTGTAIEDFAVKGGDTGTYENFGGLNAANSIELIAGVGPGKTDLSMGYQYTFDMNDVPGDYRVYLTYTASTS